MKKSIILFLLLVISNYYAISQINMLSNGYIGLGTTTPQCNVDIRGITKIMSNNGGIQFTNIYGYPVIEPTRNNIGEIGYNYTWSNLRVSTIYYTTLVQIPSDERMKDKIRNLDHSLNKVKQMRGVKYDIKPEFFNIGDSSASKVIRDTLKNQIGLIAQELLPIFPEAVVYDSVHSIYGVNYISLIPVLIEAIKEQQTVIDAQNTKIEALEKLIKKGSGSKSATVNTGTSIPSKSATLSQNVPNPFNQNTTIGYYLPETVNNATLYIYDMNGIQIKSIPVTAKGEGKITINGNELRPGMYLYTLIANGAEIDTKRMILTE
jgi:hypothetical protein